MKKAKLAKEVILFFIVSGVSAFLILFLLIYNFMGLNFLTIIKEMFSGIIISIITFVIVSYIIYILLKPITLIEQGINPVDKDLIIKTAKRVGLFLIVVNLLGFIIAPAIALSLRIVIDGFLRWSTIRIFIICCMSGIIIGILQYLYLIFKIRNLKQELQIIEFEYEKGKIGLKLKVFLITFLIAFFTSMNFYLLLLANEEKLAGISHFAILNRESNEKNIGYFTKLLELAQKSGDSEVKKEAQYLITNWENFNKKTLLKSTLFFLLIMSIFSIFLYVLVNGIVSMLIFINNKVKEISKIEGDLTKFLVKTNDDEIGELQVSINKLLVNINRFFYIIYDTLYEINLKNNSERNNINILINSNEEYFKIFSDLNKDIQKHIEKVKNIGSFVKKIVNLNEDNFKIIQNQSTMIEESSASIEEMAQSIKSVATATSNANSIGKNLELASREGLSAVLDMKDSIDRITQFGSTIMEIANTISNIADQTDLLAMNAAIEAAHAGEYGKGFAVVADEIRKLAENSNNQAKEIAKLLKSMTDVINIAQQKSENMNLAMQKIQNDVEKTIRIIDEIDNATKEQLQNSSDNMKVIQELVDITSKIMNNLDSQKKENNVLIENIDIMEKFSEHINEKNTKQMDHINILKTNLETFRHYFEYINQNLEILSSMFSKIKLLDKKIIEEIK